MRLLISSLLFAISVHAFAQVAPSKTEDDARKAQLAKEAAIIDDVQKGKPPDFTKISRAEWEAVIVKWRDANMEHGIPKDHILFMEKLEKESKKPAKDSKFIGQWGKTATAKPQLDLAADGTFTWDYGHSKGVGIWREYEGKIIWMGFAPSGVIAAGEKQTWNAQGFCYLKDAETLVQDHIDYNGTYKRHDPVAVKANGKFDEEPTAESQVSDF